jgi:Domain of unknown function (DUF4157)
MKFSIFVLLPSAICLIQPAYACPAGQYSSMGMCLPEIGGAVGQGFEHLKKEIPAQIGGNPLEGWLNASRNSAVGTSQPIPPQIRQALTGYIEDDVMNRARFKVDDNGVLNLGHLTMKYGDADAITLVDVIVFRNANDAFNNASLWAHELTHVKQYRDWGTHSFAIQYARDYNSVENPAYAVGNGFSAWYAAHGTGFQPVAQPFQPTITFGSYCSTPQGRFGPGRTAPLGSPCNVPMPYGVLMGQVTL